MLIEVSPRDLYERRHVIDAVALDRAAIQLHARSTEVDSLTLDLSKASFIDHDCLLLLGGLFAERTSRGFSTQLELPDNESVIDFLRAWKFPEFLELVSGSSPAFSSETYAKIRRREFSATPRYVSFVWGPDGTQHPITLLHSLAITTVSLSHQPWADATVGSRRFLLRNFTNVVRRTLGKAAVSQLADVVREAVLNASAHPSATLAATSSHFRPILTPSHEDSSAELTDRSVNSGNSPSTAPTLKTELQFSIWDNGEPIASTLRRAMGQNLPITSDRFGEERIIFRVRVEEVEGGYERVELTDYDDRAFQAARHNNAAILTCAAFMLGVSSDLKDVTLRRSPSATNSSGGVGLAIIRQAALDSNKGRIEYRSGSMLLKASRTRNAPNGTYDFEVSTVPQQLWHIQGNLLLVTMPLLVKS